MALATDRVKSDVENAQVAHQRLLVGRHQPEDPLRRRRFPAVVNVLGRLELSAYLLQLSSQIRAADGMAEAEQSLKSIASNSCIIT